jgi:hypothetical protein
MDRIDPVVLQRAADRGTLVHTICGAIVQDIGEPEMTENISGYVESFKKWWRSGHEVILQEKRFYCDELMITGQIDLFINFHGINTNGWLLLSYV